MVARLWFLSTIASCDIQELRHIEHITMVVCADYRFVRLCDEGVKSASNNRRGIQNRNTFDYFTIVVFLFYNK